MLRNIIALDIDGCLISEDGNVSDDYYKSLAWLAKYIAEANLGKCPNICLCTGRSALFTEAISFLIGWPQFPAIVENGSIFFDPLTKDIRFSPLLAKKTQRILLQISKKIVPAILKRYPGLLLLPGQEVNITFRRKIGETLISVKSLKTAIRRFIARAVKKKVLKTVASKNSISIVPAGINKGVAVEMLAQERELNLRHCVGIGDSKFDIPFLERVGLIGCPQNADDICKRFVRERNGRVSKYCYAEGVVDVIKYFSQTE